MMSGREFLASFGFVRDLGGTSNLYYMMQISSAAHVLDGHGGAIPHSPAAPVNSQSLRTYLGFEMVLGRFGLSIVI
jgi:hypothetical protein